MKNLKLASVMLVRRADGLILGVTRKDELTKFGLVGGKVDPGETPEEAAIRETQEETGIIVTKCKYLYDKVVPAIHHEGLDFHCYCYEALEWHGEISTNEPARVDWVTVEAILDGAYPEYNKNVLIAAGVIKE